MPMGEMVKKLNLTSPTVRNRLKDLEKSGVFKVSGLIDPSQHKEMITALVAMGIKSEREMNHRLTQITNNKEVL